MYLYKLVLRLGCDGDGEQDPVVRLRSLESIEVFIQELISHLPDLPEVKILAELFCCSGKKEDGSSTWPPPAPSLEKALQVCVSNPAVVRDPCFSQFLWEQEDDLIDPDGHGNVSDNSPLLAAGDSGGVKSAIDFILQPVEMASEYIPPRRYVYKDIHLQKGDTAMWKFSIGGGYDISFAVFYHKETDNDAIDKTENMDGKMIKYLDSLLSESHSTDCKSDSDVIVAVPSQRLSMHGIDIGKHIQGSYCPEYAGMVRLIWDNRYSRINGKHISYATQAVNEETLQAAFVAAEDLEESKSRSQSKLHRRILSSSAEISISVDGPWRKSMRKDSVMAGYCEEADTEIVGQEVFNSTLKFPASSNNVGMVRQYVESGTDHRNVVLSANENAASKDIVLDKDFIVSSVEPEKSPCRDGSGRGYWLGSVLNTITNAHPTPHCTDISAASSSASPPVKSPLFPVSGSYYHIHPSSVYNASRALLQLVWSNYGLPFETQGSISESPSPQNAVKPPCSEKEHEGEVAAAQMADLICLAQHVDELEDRNAILRAERDQARAIGIRDQRLLDMAREDVVCVEQVLASQEQETQLWREKAQELQKEVIKLNSSELRNQKRFQEGENMPVVDVGLQQNTETENTPKDVPVGVTYVEERNLELEVYKEMLNRQITDFERGSIGELKEYDNEKSRQFEKEDVNEVGSERSSEAAKSPNELPVGALGVVEHNLELELSEGISSSQMSDFERVVNDKRNDNNSEIERLRCDRNLREFEYRVNELQSQLHILECQHKIEVTNLRQKLRQNSAMAALSKAEAAESRMLLDLYRNKVSKLKAQKKVLVKELRSLRDLGMYEGRITVDHAFPSSLGQSLKSISDDTENRIEKQSDGNCSTTEEESVVGHEHRGHSSGKTLNERGINFSVLKLATVEESASTNDNLTPSDEVINFLSLEESHGPGEPTIDFSTPQASKPTVDKTSRTVESLRLARLRQQTISSILQDDPSNSSLKGLLGQLTSDVNVLQERITIEIDDADDHLASDDSSWMNSVQDEDYRAV